LLLFFEWTTVAALLAAPAVVAGLYAIGVDVDETAAVDDGEGAPARTGSGVDSLGEFLSESRALFVGGFALVFAIVMLNGLFYRGVLTFLPNLLEGLPAFEPIPLGRFVPGIEPGSGRTLNPERYFYAGLLLVGVGGQYLGGKLTDRVPIEYALATVFGGLAVLALAFLPVAALGLGPLLVFGAVLGFTLFTVQPLYQAIVADYTPAGTRGLSYGFTYLGTFGVGALGGAIAGTILTYADVGVLFATLAGFAVVAAALALGLSRRARPTEA
jgi:MFS family permease